MYQIQCVQSQMVRGKDYKDMRLNYTSHNNSAVLGADYENVFLQSDISHVSSLYSHNQIKNDFINLRTNIVDLNPAMITKCIQGT